MAFSITYDRSCLWAISLVLLWSQLYQRALQWDTVNIWVYLGET